MNIQKISSATKTDGYSIEPTGWTGWKITANHTLDGVDPHMITWWWDHINSTARYKLWHPTDHYSFQWLVPPQTNGHIGAIQRIQETFNGFPSTGPSTVTITWEDPSLVAHLVEYEEVLCASGIEDTPFGPMKGFLMHEYTAHGTSSTLMRSHFWFPVQAPEIMIKNLYEHNKQEMAHLAHFLPWLYRGEVLLPQGGIFTHNQHQQTLTFDSASMRYVYQEKQGGRITSNDLVFLTASQHIDLSTWQWQAKNNQ